jgi:heme-degrading monooxygenase HmoA
MNAAAKGAARGKKTGPEDWVPVVGVICPTQPGCARERQAEMFIATNNFKVNEGREADFETQWRNRQSYLSEVPGFVSFALLRGDNRGEYVSQTTWESREAFLAWTRSEAFAAGHRQGSVAGVLEGPPVVKLYEAVIVERAGEKAQA